MKSLLFVIRCTELNPKHQNVINFLIEHNYWYQTNYGLTKLFKFKTMRKPSKCCVLTPSQLSQQSHIALTPNGPKLKFWTLLSTFCETARFNYQQIAHAGVYPSWYPKRAGVYPNIFFFSTGHPSTLRGLPLLCRRYISIFLVSSPKYGVIWKVMNVLASPRSIWR